MKKRLLAIFCSLSAAWGVMSAQELSELVEIHFLQSKSQIDLGLKDNRSALEKIVSRMRACENPDSGLTLKKVRVVGSASPEGSVEINGRLSEERARNIFNYINERVELSDSLTSFIFMGRDWSGLRALVMNDTSVPQRADVIALLDRIESAPDNGGSWSKGPLDQLKEIGHGRAYRYMYEKLFPALRFSRLYVDYVSLPKFVEPEMPDSVYELIEPEVVIEQEYVMPEIAEVKEKRPFYMALKTNMLYDVLAVPSISAEFYVGKNFSVVGNWMYGWWSKDSAHRYWRLYGGDVAARWWFGRAAHEKPLTGHHIGLFAGLFTYDFEFGGRGWMGGLPGGTLWDRVNLNAGVEYGYSLPIGRRLNIDFTIGLGYVGGKYYEYVPQDGHYVWQSTHNLRWFGPAKAEVSLTWLLGHDNYNRKKGGEK